MSRREVPGKKRQKEGRIKKANQNSGDTSINAVSELNLKFEAANQVDPLGKLATISVKPKSKDS